MFVVSQFSQQVYLYILYLYHLSLHHNFIVRLVHSPVFYTKLLTLNSHALKILLHVGRILSGVFGPQRHNY